VASFSLCNPHDIPFTVKAVLEQTSAVTQKTERITFHVERRWIEAIRRQADLDGLTITQVVNQAFRQYFERP